MADNSAELRDHINFIRDNTELLAPPLVPEIRLHLATEIVPIWRLTEEELAEQGVPPPFWAFAWAGGQALARYILDHPDRVRGRSVLDFGAGSGLVAVAAMKAGAARALAADIDPFAIAAIALNAAENGVAVDATADHLVGSPLDDIDIVLAGDICYERPLAERVTAWLKAARNAGIDVLVGDPGRSYLPRADLTSIAEYEVATTRELEDREIRRTGVWTLVR